MRRDGFTLVKLIVVLAIVLAVLLTFLGFFAPIDAALNLVFGWVFYLRRVVPQVAVAPAGVATALVCLALLAVGTHLFLTWLHAGLTGGAKDGAPRWRRRWSASLIMAVLVMFVAGMAVTGMAHQAGWLLTSKEPFLVSEMQRLLDRVASTENLKQIALALHGYHDDRGTFPPGGIFNAAGRPLHGWQAMILPYLDQRSLHSRIDFSLPWDDAPNRAAYATMVNAYLNPAIPLELTNGYAASHYAANVRLYFARPAMTLSLSL